MFAREAQGIEGRLWKVPTSLLPTCADCPVCPVCPDSREPASAAVNATCELALRRSDPNLRTGTADWV